MHDGAAIDKIIKGVRAVGKVNHAVIETSTGIAMRLSDKDEFYRSYVSDARQDGRVKVEFDLREPRPNSGATGGAILVVNVTDGCISKAALESHFGTLQLTQIPHGHSLDEQSYWSRHEAWGKLSFGFTERRPDCLSSVVLAEPDRT